MPSRTKLKNAAIAARSAALPKIPDELINQFVTGPMTGEAVNAASMALKKALIKRAMGAELGHHLGYPAGAKPEAATNQRNGKIAKTVQTGEGSVRIEVPRDRDGSFEPILTPKHEPRFTGFEETSIALCARGMTMREIQGDLPTASVVCRKRRPPPWTSLSASNTKVQTRLGSLLVRSETTSVLDLAGSLKSAKGKCVSFKDMNAWH
jgi:hypothetical protein